MAQPHWALKNIDQEVTATGVKILVWTFQPCHLWMRWTTTKPQYHPLERTVRGLPLMLDRRFCFVAYEDNEQEEGDDTYLHTFLKEPWAHCETRWFYFHGRLGGERSPSTSAIFEKHRIAPEFWKIILEPWSVVTEPPDLTRVILEPWTVIIEPPEFTQVILEPWSDSLYILIILEPWTVELEPPAFSLVISEEWTS